ncbi:MAG: pentapeptide repeat-containing protein [Desulfobacterales bacterium]|nr:pentapeptide repeat-containing protein [Desulfobacterales bacterium]
MGKKFTDEEWNAYLKEHQAGFEGNPKHLRKILEMDSWKWNEWRKENPDVEINLKGASLRNANLQEAKLFGANLQEADLFLADLQEADLSMASLQFANMSQANLQKAILNRSNLQKAMLNEAMLQETDLYKADLQEANLSKAKMQKANLFQAKMQNAELSEAKLQEVEFYEANLQDAKLLWADLQGAKLRNTNMQGAILSGANIQGVRLRYTDLTRATVGGIKYKKKIKIGRFTIWAKNSIESFRGTSVDSCKGDAVFKRYAQDQDFLEGFKELQPAWFYRPLYWLWKISSDCGQSMLLWMFWSIMFALIFAGVFFWLGESHFKPTELTFNLQSMIYYSVVTFTTLGFGDIIPKTNLAAWWVMAEVIVGYIMLGGLISIFATKLARRS